jgi:hypothetical protein
MTVLVATVEPVFMGMNEDNETSTLLAAKG